MRMKNMKKEMLKNKQSSAKQLARNVTLIYCLLASSFASAQRSTVAAKQCYKLLSQVDARTCLEAKSKESASEVKKVEASLHSALEKWDTESEFKNLSITQLDESKLKYLDYRESQCEFQASLAAGGNAASDRRFLCYINLDENRLIELQATLKSLK